VHHHQIRAVNDDSEQESKEEQEYDRKFDRRCSCLASEEAMKPCAPEISHAPDLTQLISYPVNESFRESDRAKTLPPRKKLWTHQI
jgi:hypothetical protein